MSNNKTKKKYILITGCSSGIGYETAKYLKKNKYNIIVSCRKKIDYKKLSQEFDHVVLIDIAESKSINKSFFSIKKIIKNNILYAIFCNAGYGQWGAVEDLSINLIKSLTHWAAISASCSSIDKEATPFTSSSLISSANP